MSCFILPFWTLCWFNIVSLQCLISRKNKRVRLNRLWELTRRFLVLQNLCPHHARYTHALHLLTFIWPKAEKSYFMFIFYRSLIRIHVFYWVSTMSYMFGKALDKYNTISNYDYHQKGVVQIFCRHENWDSENRPLSQDIADNGGVWIRIHVYLIIKLLLFNSSLRFWSHMEFLCCGVCTQSRCFIFISWSGLK